MLTLSHASRQVLLDLFGTQESAGRDGANLCAPASGTAAGADVQIAETKAGDQLGLGLAICLPEDMLPGAGITGLVTEDGGVSGGIV